MYTLTSEEGQGKMIFEDIRKLLKWRGKSTKFIFSQPRFSGKHRAIGQER
jgi:hypothetical protein